jgi:hypothetical protein
MPAGSLPRLVSGRDDAAVLDQEGTHVTVGRTPQIAGE